ncbi:hypothetical protein [Legionella pneumophila]|uniref:hypothetical protein n=1 Tax=Legionella pneumophila TaxID=446 RepID=UPI000770B0E5|nr:hypothetical protein [Legionella pneumophila]CZG08485.1 Uncharacterised protein [Legionella pneumophila]CZJ12745.1 Uncharacterised protein [Legionella pneumophila]CZJ25707.1 Uncharacterised protein [Legionella pneumophila]CZJ30294.1 Uncharacterised protein [Legionella pneumophila]CZJ31284.1 Uncharacterised protein [Legionella pneumophila]
MKSKKILILGLSITLTAITSASYAKKIFPSDIIGRDLNYPGMGWLGHVGIATRPMMDSSGMSTPANQVIEILTGLTKNSSKRMDFVVHGLDSF